MDKKIKKILDLFKIDPTKALLICQKMWKKKEEQYDRRKNKKDIRTI